MPSSAPDPITPFECPCCGAPMASRPPAEALRYGRLPPLVRRVVDVLLRSYPRTMSFRRLADLVYADDPNGGPDQAERCLSSSIAQARHEIAKTGWRIGGASGYREAIGIWPLEAKPGAEAKQG